MVIKLIRLLSVKCILKSNISLFAIMTGLYCFLVYTSTFLFAFHETKTDYSHLNIAFFNASNASEYILFSLSSIDSIVSNLSSFNITNPTVLYIHGFRENLTSQSVQTVVKAFIKRKSHNILVVDWSIYCNGSYILEAVPNLVKIAKLMGGCVYSLITHNVLDLNKLHVVGHSLGGQMSGYIGRWIIALSGGNMKLKRITALDPAKPLFYLNLVFLPSLSYLNAENVDVIHTDAGVLGADVPAGDLDFWPNGGVYQQGCLLSEEPLCNHARSWHYFAESVASFEPKFSSIKCSSFANFIKSNCSKTTPWNNMGIDADFTLHGNFYLQTYGSFPFSRGMLGTYYTTVIDDHERNITDIQ